jgi:hypothetical protein
MKEYKQTNERRKNENIPGIKAIQTGIFRSMVCSLYRSIFSKPRSILQVKIEATTQNNKQLKESRISLIQ